MRVPCSILPACLACYVLRICHVCCAVPPRLRACFSGRLRQAVEDQHNQFPEIPPILVPWRKRPEALFRPPPCQLLVGHVHVRNTAACPDSQCMFSALANLVLLKWMAQCLQLHLTIMVVCRTYKPLPEMKYYQMLENGLPAFVNGTTTLWVSRRALGSCRASLRHCRPTVPNFTESATAGITVCFRNGMDIIWYPWYHGTGMHESPTQAAVTTRLSL